MNDFKALEIRPTDKGLGLGRMTTMRADQLDAGEVTLRVHYSSINYKDALAANGTARILQNFGSYVPDFASTVIYAHRDLMQNHPELLRAFLSAWFEAKDALRADMDGSIACTVHKTGAPPEIARQVIEEVAPDFSPDGRFRPAAMAVLAQSFVETGVLPTAPDPTTLYTEAFLPGR